MDDKSYFFCGIGGSGMLPLAMILKGLGASVSGSDRSRDQGRTPDKFDWIASRGIALYPQDGSGLSDTSQQLVASAAVEDSVPDIAAANRLGCTRQTRAELLSTLFNAAAKGIAVGGTSGKSTVTGMIGHILRETGANPTIMNGAVMKNFVSPENPYASAAVGSPDLFVAEVDESDGSIALYDPAVAVLNNVSLDHKSLEELRALFGGFCERADHVVWNVDDDESRAIIGALGITNVVGFGFGDGANIQATEVEERPLGSRFTLDAHGAKHVVALKVPGRHNIANALAAIAACEAAGVSVTDAVAAIGSFAGLARRFDIVGDGNDITVIDDFGHNPEKVAATLKTLKAFPGRVLAFFQPHGFGPIKVMGAELGETVATLLDGDDRFILCDPVYHGGTTDRSVGAELIVEAALAAGGDHDSADWAEHIPAREDVGKRLTALARPGDRIVIMGARDDTLSAFAAELLEHIGSG